MMGQLSAPRPSWRRAAGPWPRSIRRPWVRPGDLAGMSRLFAVIPSLPRAELSRLTTRMIDRLDEIDGDVDVELNGDEADGTLGEDDFHSPSLQYLSYPGCPISDPGEEEHDLEREEAHD